MKSEALAGEEAATVRLGRHGHRLLAETIGTLLAKNLSFVINGLLVPVVFTRILDTHEWGSFSLSRNALVVLVSVSLMGMNLGVVRFVAHLRVTDQAPMRQYASVAFSLSLMGALVLSAAWFGVSRFVALSLFQDGTLVVPFRLVALGTVAIVMFVMMNEIMRGLGHLGAFNGFRVANDLLFLLLSLTLFFFASRTAPLALGALIIAAGLCAIAGEWFLTKNGMTLRLAMDRDIARDLLRYSLPLLPTSFLLFQVGSVNNFVIGAFLDVESVGLYEVAQKLAFSVAAVTGPLGLVVLPLLAELAALRDEHRIDKLLHVLLSATLYIQSFVCLFSVIFARDIMGLLFQTPFLRAVSPFQVLVIGSLFFSLYDLLTNFVATLSSTAIILRMQVIALVVVVICDMLLIPRIGVIGAAVSTMISYVIIGMAVLRQMRKIVAIRVGRLQPAAFFIIMVTIGVVGTVLQSYTRGAGFVMLGNLALMVSLFTFLLRVLKVTWFMQVLEIGRQIWAQLLGKFVGFIGFIG